MVAIKKNDSEAGSDGLSVSIQYGGYKGRLRSPKLQKNSVSIQYGGYKAKKKDIQYRPIFKYPSNMVAIKGVNLAFKTFLKEICKLSSFFNEKNAIFSVDLTIF